MPDTVLTAAIGIGEAVLPVAADPGPGPVFIDSECMIVVSRGVTSILVQRAAYGTSLAAHAVGTAVVDAQPAFVGSNTGLVLSGGITSTPTELNYLHNSSPGVSVASKALVLGANKNTDVLALPVGGLAIGAGAGTAVTPTAAELNVLHSAGVTNQDLIDLHATVNGAPFYGLSGFLAETIPRQLCPEANSVIATTGQIFNQLIYILGGTSVTSITFWSATTGANIPTHYAFGLYSYSATAPSLIGSTADQTTTAWAGNTKLTLALTGGPFVIATSGLYYVAVGIVATTVPTLKGMPVRLDGTLGAGAPILAGINATGYTTGAMPGTIGATTAGLTSVWAGLS